MAQVDKTTPKATPAPKPTTPKAPPFTPQVPPRKTEMSRQRRGALGIMEITPKETGIKNCYELRLGTGPNAPVLVRATRTTAITGAWQYRDELSGVETSWGEICFMAIQKAEALIARNARLTQDKKAEAESKAAEAKAAREAKKSAAAIAKATGTPTTEPATAPTTEPVAS